MLDKAKILFRKAISKVAGTHEQKLTLTVDVNLPDHEERTTTALFAKTKKQLVARDTGCFICGSTENLEAHHWIIEWAFANAVDWNLVKADFPDFPDWDKLFETKDYSLFVDNMIWNGKLLCHDHHVGKNEGVHFTPYPTWVIQRYLREGYIYSSTQTIHHENIRNSDVK